MQADTDAAGDASPRNHVERIIASGRLFIILGCLLAIRLDPSTSLLARISGALLGVYLLYIVAVVAHVWLGRAPTHRWRVGDQVLDGTVGFLLLQLTGGTGSAFFSYLSFPVLFATLRWQWRGALAAGVPTTVAFLALTLVESYLGVPVESESLVMRSLYLGALTGLLCYIGAYEQRVRRTMRAIALWNPRAANDETDVATLLETAGRLIGARRAVLGWTERGESVLHMAFWTGVSVRCWEEANSSVDDLVVAGFGAIDFLDHDVSSPAAPVMWFDNGQLHQYRRTRAVPVTVQQRFAMGAVISLRLHGDLVQGRLFLLDVPSMTSDDLLMGGLVARRVQAGLQARLTARQLAAAAAAEERVQLARNIHDGALQALTGIRLQLEGALRLLATKPEAAEASLHELEETITSEHRMLRRLVSRLQRAQTVASEPEESFADLVDALVARIERQWNVRVQIETPVEDEQFEYVARSVMAEVYQILREGLVNAARHARAKTVTLALGVERREIRMTIADDGQGFAFTGRHDLARLIRYDMGPTVLRERVASLGGNLVIDSTSHGSRLEIGIPLDSSPRLSPRPSSTER